MGREYSKPMKALGYEVRHLPGEGYIVLEPSGKIAKVATPFKMQAERDCAALQAAADKLVKRGTRACLRCQTTFMSEGIHNRMCGRCRLSSEGEQSVRPAIRHGGHDHEST